MGGVVASWLDIGGHPRKRRRHCVPGTDRPGCPTGSEWDRIGAMGEKVEAGPFTREDRTRHRQKVRTGLDALARMLTQSTFDFDRPMTGLEIELNLVDEECEPAMRNAEVLEVIADPQFVTELGKFNIEINVAPRALSDNGLSSFEDSVRSALNH